MPFKPASLSAAAFSLILVGGALAGPSPTPFAFSRYLFPDLKLSWSPPTGVAAPAEGGGANGSSLGTITFELERTGVSGIGSWIAFGLSSSGGMMGGDVGVYEPSGERVSQFTLSAYEMSGVARVPPAASPLVEGASAVSSSPGAGAVRFSFTRQLAAGPYPGALAIPAAADGDVDVIWAVGAEGQASLTRRHAAAGAGRINFTSGAFAPRVRDMVLLHAGLMLLAWALLIPLAIMLARYGKGCCGGSSDGGGGGWFLGHVIANSLALAAMVGGVAVAVLMTRGAHLAHAHALVGVVAFSLAMLQPANALLRPPQAREGASRTQRRFAWELMHRLAGYGAVALAIAAAVLGILLAELDRRWLWAFVAYWAALIVANIPLSAVYASECACCRSCCGAAPPPVEDAAAKGGKASAGDLERASSGDEDVEESPLLDASAGAQQQTLSRRKGGGGA